MVHGRDHTIDHGQQCGKLHGHGHERRLFDDVGKLHGDREPRAISVVHLVAHARHLGVGGLVHAFDGFRGVQLVVRERVAVFEQPSGALGDLAD